MPLTKAQSRELCNENERLRKRVARLEEACQFALNHIVAGNVQTAKARLRVVLAPPPSPEGGLK
jgi:hypothetical protein